MIVSLLIASVLTAGATIAADVGGQVVLDGKPVGGAMVMVSGVTRDELRYVPSNQHRDLSLWTRTDEEGRFLLPAGDPSARLWTVIVGPDGASATVQLPSENPLIEVTRRSPGADAKSCRVRVVDASGRPVSGAFVLPSKMYFGAMMGGWGGELSQVARFTGPDGDAELHLLPHHGHGDRETLALSLRVVAPGYAPTDVRRIEFNQDVMEVRLAKGCRVTGQVTGPDGPVAGAWVEGACKVESGNPIFSRLRAQTDAAGVFVFEHVPPGVELVIACPAWGNSHALVSPVAKVTALKDGETLDAGMFRLEKGRTIGGRVVKRGAEAPANLAVALYHESAWLTWSAPLENGSFTFTNVPDGGPYTLYVCGQDVRISAENAAYSPTRYNVLYGLVTRDNTAMEILLASAAEEAETDQPRDRPLRGVESEGAQ